MGFLVDVTRDGKDEARCRRTQLLAKPPAEEQPGGKPSVQGTQLFVLRVRKPGVWGPSMESIATGILRLVFGQVERQVKVVRRSVHRKLLKSSGTEISGKWQRPSRLNQRFWKPAYLSLCFLLFKMMVFLSISQGCYKG